MKRCILIIEDSKYPQLNTPVIGKGVSVHYFFVDKLNLKDFYKFVKDSRDEKTK